MLKQRVITAIILAAVVVSIILIPDSFWVSILFALILFVATKEMLALTIKPTVIPASLASALLAALFWWSLPLNPALILWQSLAGLTLWVLIAIALFVYRYSGHWPLLARVIVLGLGLDLLWICVHGLVYLHSTYGGELLLYLLSLVWVADIGAYFSGRRFGKHKLAPAISPGKTWEGVAGGLVANLFWIICIYQISAGWGLELVEFILISIATSLISIVGDLFESILKRETGVKDSGKILPGHGGMLDRIDSVIAASPVFVAGIFIAGQL
ncbi:MAG: phosphatidate cytidylyltransferase [Gammaproteobacteria bacterium]|nr:phosphatidate cytidylyltransferase [Gammaproteobacteria bacterium]